MLPEHPIIISPTLAATIGLEEAVLLQTLSELLKHRGLTRTAQSNRRWLNIDHKELGELLPFWQQDKIRKLLESLKNLGLVISENVEGGDKIWVAIDQASPDSLLPAKKQAASSSAEQAKPTVARLDKDESSNLIPLDWQPDDNWIRLCKQHSIPEDFIQSLVPEFVTYWRDRGQARFSWGNAFYKHVLKEWRHEQTRRGAHELASTMSPEWQPSQDAVDILEKSGVSAGFIEDAVPEFVLYWRERGVVHGAWNTKFIEHIRRQWAKFSASFGVDDTPRPIPEDWQPSAECYEILALAEIDADYATSKIPEFVMYWRDSKQARASWNTVFLQFIKMDWARRLSELQTRGNTYAQDQAIAGSTEEKVRARLEQLADRSWAD
ncbi:MAG: DnaT-like ssDNA-binding domain-containing protein [Gammaproteobacteria bacterium]